jgi:hypothetical protein
MSLGRPGPGRPSAAPGRTRSHMSKRFARTLLTITAAGVATVLTVAAAMAATTWTIRPGGAVTAKSGLVVLKDATTGSLVTCNSSTIKATLKAGTGLSGSGMGTISSFTFNNCTGPLSLTYTLTLSHLPFTLNAMSYDSGTGTTTAKITGIHGTFMGPSCSYVLDGTGATMHNGTLAITYANDTHKLKFLTTDGNLHVYQLRSCGFLGPIHNNDHLTLSATGAVIPSQTITSP